MPVQLTAVSYRYGPLPALTDIDLELPKGSLTVLCGMTGSGKSTLLRLLAGLAEPSGGTIAYSEEASSPSVSIVFQHPESQLFGGTVLKDVEYGLEQSGVRQPQRSREAEQALSHAGLAPDSYGPRSPYLLSGGEKRRVCIAGALAPRPDVLLLDEPTAGLDPQAARGLLETVRELRDAGYTIVAATHDLDAFLPLADQAAVLAQGRLRYAGPTAGLWEEPRVLEDAGLAPPAYIRIGRMLMKRGLLDALPASTAGLPAALDGRLAYPGDGAQRPRDAGAAPADAPPPGRSASGDGGRAMLPDAADASGQPAAGLDKPAVRPMTGAMVRSLDPRVKWLAMALGSLVLLGINGFPPLVLAALMIGALLAAGGISRKRARWFYRPFLPMFLLLWLLSAFYWNSASGGLAFSAKGAEAGGLSVLKLLLLLSLGFIFTETTSGAPLREGLEWAISPLRRFGVRTRNWSLAVSVTLQFVPWVLEKADELRLALASRGGRKFGLARWTPKQLSLMAVPLMLQVITMGDELSTAIEARGYDPDKPRTPWLQLRWQRQDTFALIVVLLAAALLYGIALYG
ncbi:Energy-coupling factor transporter ATP-binding protein EcfA2 [compost metagenome]